MPHFLICKKCGYRHVCPNCSIYLTYHKILNKIICHHCGYKSTTKKNVQIKIYYVIFLCMDQELKKSLKN